MPPVVARRGGTRYARCGRQRDRLVGSPRPALQMLRPWCRHAVSRRIRAETEQQDNTRRVFASLSRAAIAVVMLLLVYGNYMIWRTYVTPLTCAALMTVLLSPVMDALVACTDGIAQRAVHPCPARWQLPIVLGVTATAAAGALLDAAGELETAVHAGVVAMLIAGTAVAAVGRRAVAALLLVTGIALFTALPLYVVARICLRDASVGLQRVRAVPRQQRTRQCRSCGARWRTARIDSCTRWSRRTATSGRTISTGTREYAPHVGRARASPLHRPARTDATVQIFKRLHGLLLAFGCDTASIDPAKLRPILSAWLAQIGANYGELLSSTTVLFVQNIGSLVTDVAVFFSGLFYMLAFKDDLQRHAVELSPFGRDDSRRLYLSVYHGVRRIVLSTMLVGLLHALTTLATFRIAGFETVLLPAMASGFLAIIPVFSSWIVWLPACAAVYIDSADTQSLATVGLIALPHLLVSVYLTPLIYRLIPGGHPYFIGMTIVAGIAAFGPVGALYGPLLAGTLVTAVDIYKQHMARALRLA